MCDFFILTVIKIDAPRSALPSPHCLPSILQPYLLGVKEFVLKYEFVENIFFSFFFFFFFCVTVRDPPTCLVSYSQSHFVSALWATLRLTAAPEEDITRNEKRSKKKRIKEKKKKSQDASRNTKQSHKQTHTETLAVIEPTSATSSLVMLVGVGCVFCGRLYGNGLLDSTFLRGRQRTLNPWQRFSVNLL